MTDSAAWIQADAANILQEVPKWELVPGRWDVVAGVLESIATALAEGDMKALQDAIIDLELVGPVRNTPIGSVPTEPAPRKVRERTNQLVYQLPQSAKDQPAEARDET